jgi:hypothetical protein
MLKIFLLRTHPYAHKLLATFMCFSGVIPPLYAKPYAHMLCHLKVSDSAVKCDTQSIPICNTIWSELTGQSKSHFNASLVVSHGTIFMLHIFTLFKSHDFLATLCMFSETENTKIKFHSRYCSMIVF